MLRTSVVVAGGGAPGIQRMGARDAAQPLPVPDMAPFQRVTTVLSAAPPDPARPAPPPRCPALLPLSSSPTPFQPHGSPGSLSNTPGQSRPRAFAHAVPAIWDAILPNLRGLHSLTSSRSQLRCHLLGEASSSSRFLHPPSSCLSTFTLSMPPPCRHDL